MIHSMLIGMSLMLSVNLDTGARSWRAVNDSVMGGVSSGGMTQEGEMLVFTGELSLENNGGFSSVRRLVEQDLSGISKVRIEVRGDGRMYQFRIRQSDRFDGVAWRAMFIAKDSWQTIEIPLNQFVPVFRGRTVAQAGPVVPSDIRQIGFLLADKNAGPFKLEIRQITFLRPDEVVMP
jgi:monofunctional biosynthetic peptidoglycan transglycosylase